MFTSLTLRLSILLNVTVTVWLWSWGSREFVCVCVCVLKWKKRKHEERRFCRKSVSFYRENKIQSECECEYLYLNETFLDITENWTYLLLYQMLHCFVSRLETSPHYAKEKGKIFKSSGKKFRYKKTNYSQHSINKFVTKPELKCFETWELDDGDWI